MSRWQRVVLILGLVTVAAFSIGAYTDWTNLAGDGYISYRLWVGNYFSVDTAYTRTGFMSTMKGGTSVDSLIATSYVRGNLRGNVTGLTDSAKTLSNQGQKIAAYKDSLAADSAAFRVLVATVIGNLTGSVTGTASGNVALHGLADSTKYWRMRTLDSTSLSVSNAVNTVVAASTDTLKLGTTNYFYPNTGTGAGIRLKDSTAVLIDTAGRYLVSYSPPQAFKVDTVTAIQVMKTGTSLYSWPVWALAAHGTEVVLNSWSDIFYLAGGDKIWVKATNANSAAYTFAGAVGTLRVTLLNRK